MVAAAENNVDYSLLDIEKPIRILAVDDDIVSMGFLQAQIAELGHKVLAAHNGQEAIQVLQEKYADIDVVLMDREMPVMDGLTAVRRIKDHPNLRNIPVIMVTGADSAQEIKEGIDAGVFYYLTKPVEESMLRSVLSAAVRKARQDKTLESELGRHLTSFNLIETCKFVFQTIAEAESLSAFIAHCFPDPERVIGGIGELLINAVEHGNLSVGYSEKGKLISAGTWRSEVDRIQKLSQNAQKFAAVTIARKDDGIYLVVEDQGSGFDWKEYISIDPARAGDNHGRGIAQANAISFDKLTFNDKGNKVVAFVSREKQIEW